MKLPLFSNVLRSGFVIRPYSSTLLCAPVMNKQSNSGILNLPTNSNFKTIYRLTRRFLLPWTSQVAGHKMAAIKSPLDKTYFSLHLCIIWWYFCSFPVSIIVFEKSSLTDYLVLIRFKFKFERLLQIISSMDFTTGLTVLTAYCSYHRHYETP